MRNNEAILAGMMGFVCLFLVIVLVVVIFYLLTLQKALSRVSPHNRLMEPGLVWLSLIPLFNIIWAFFIVTRVPDSLRNEFRERDQDDGSDYGKGIGMANAILTVVTIPLNMITQVTQSPILALLLLPIGLAGLVLFIIFWVKIAGYSGRLAASHGSYGERDRFDDE